MTESFLHTGYRFPKTNSLVIAITRGLVAVEYGERPRGRLYASDAGLCARQSVLNSIHPSNLEDPVSQMYVQVGSAIETVITRAMERAGVLVFDQYKVPDVDGLSIGGRIDAIAMVGDRVRIVEIKSCGDLPSTAKSHQEPQAALYAALTGIPAVLLYVSRKVTNASGQLLMRTFDVDEDTERRAMLQLCLATKYLPHDAVPDVPIDIVNEGQCGFCQWKGLCWHGHTPPSDVVTLEPDKAAALQREAMRLADRLMRPEVKRQRANGILKHITSSSERAAIMLSGKSWDSLLER